MCLAVVTAHLSSQYKKMLPKDEAMGKDERIGREEVKKQLTLLHAVQA